MRLLAFYFYSSQSIHMIAEAMINFEFHIVHSILWVKTNIAYTFMTILYFA